MKSRTVRSRFSNLVAIASSMAVPGALSFTTLACSTDGQAPAKGLDAGNSGAEAGDPLSLATEAFIWGFPAVVSERTLLKLGTTFGAETLFNSPVLSPPAVHVVVAPNHDTLYSIAAIDLRANGPQVLTIPDDNNGYWTYQFLDTWTDSFQYIGTRATQGKGGTFLINMGGLFNVPPAVQQILSPTPQLVLLGRYLATSDADVAAVGALKRTLAPLDTSGGPAPPVAQQFAAAQGSPQEAGNNGAAFFDELGDVLAVNPPFTDADKAALARYAELGIGPGQHPAANANPSTSALLAQAVTAGLTRIDQAWTSTAQLKNGWTVLLDVGTYTDPLVRAAVAKYAWGANVPEEAVYPVSRADASGNPYTGTTSYTVHFDATQVPPVDPTFGFWSLTLYGPDMFLVDNSIGRYSISDRTQGFIKNADGSFDLFIQQTEPTGHTGNWLPSPAGAFSLMLRFYLPQKPILDGTYVYPPVTAVP